MIAPPSTTLSPWVPGYWITQDWHALSKRDLLANRIGPVNAATAQMHRAAVATKTVIEGIMQ